VTQHTPQPAPADLLDAYLDGRLEGGELARFEMAMANDPSLITQLEAARRIDQSLRRIAPALPMELPEALPSAPRPATSIAGRIRRTYVVIAAAAAIILAAGVWYLVTRPTAPADKPRLATPTTATGFYLQLASHGYKPAWRCNTDAEFIDFLDKRFGDAFLVRSSPTLAVIGWAYAERTVGEATAALLTTVGDDKVMLFVDSLSDDHAPPPPEQSTGLRIFRAQVGKLVVYEISPRNEASVLPMLQHVAPNTAPPDAAPAPGSRSSGGPG